MSDIEALYKTKSVGKIIHTVTLIILTYRLFIPDMLMIFVAFTYC